MSYTININRLGADENSPRLLYEFFFHKFKLTLVIFLDCYMVKKKPAINQFTNEGLF